MILYRGDPLVPVWSRSLDNNFFVNGVAFSPDGLSVITHADRGGGLAILMFFRRSNGGHFTVLRYDHSYSVYNFLRRNLLLSSRGVYGTATNARIFVSSRIYYNLAYQGYQVFSIEYFDDMVNRPTFDLTPKWKKVSSTSDNTDHPMATMFGKDQSEIFYIGKRI